MELRFLLKVGLTHFLNIRVTGLLGSESENTTLSNPPPFLHKSLRQYYSCLWQSKFQHFKGGELRGTGKMKSEITKCNCNWYRQLPLVVDQSLVRCPFSSHLHWPLPKRTVTTFLKECAKTRVGKAQTVSGQNAFCIQLPWVVQLKTNTQTLESPLAKGNWERELNA